MKRGQKKANGPRVPKRSSGPVFANLGERGRRMNVRWPLDMNVL